MNVVAVIPARGGSKRLKRKNIAPLFDNPLIYWSIEACKQSSIIRDIYISTEDEEIAEVSSKYGIKVINRSAYLAEDSVPKMEVIRDAYKQLREINVEIDVIVSVQANSPEIRSKDIDKGIKLLIENKLWEVFSIDQKDIQNGAFRIINPKCLFNTFLSAHCGVVRTDYIDVHTEEDLRLILEKYPTIAEFLTSKN